MQCAAEEGSFLLLPHPLVLALGPGDLALHSPTIGSQKDDQRSRWPTLAPVAYQDSHGMNKGTSDKERESVCMYVCISMAIHAIKCLVHTRKKKN